MTAGDASGSEVVVVAIPERHRRRTREGHGPHGPDHRRDEQVRAPYRLRLRGGASQTLLAAQPQKRSTPTRRSVRQVGAEPLPQARCSSNRSARHDGAADRVPVQSHPPQNLAQGASVESVSLAVLETSDLDRSSTASTVGRILGSAMTLAVQSTPDPQPVAALARRPELLRVPC